MLTLGKNNPRLENNVLFSLAGGRSDSDMSEKGKSGMDCLTIETCPDGKCEVTVGSGRSQLTLIDPDPNNLEKSKQSQVAFLESLKRGINHNEVNLTIQQRPSEIGKGIDGQKGSELTFLDTQGKIVALPRPKEKSNPNKENIDPKIHKNKIPPEGQGYNNEIQFETKFDKQIDDIRGEEVNTTHTT